MKNPGQDDLDNKLTHRDARMQERQFFEHDAPWATTFRHHQSLFGTNQLQNSLSVTLATQMTKSLPTIQTQVLTRLASIETDLKNIPQPPTHNATRIIADILLDFSSHVRREMEAEYPCRNWRNIWDSLYKEFHESLLSMKPTMVTKGKLDKGIFDAVTPGKSVDSAYVIDSGDEGENTNTAQSPETPSKKRKVESTPGSMRPPLSRYQTPSRTTPIRTLDLKTVGYANLRTKFQLDDISEYLKETSKSRLPGQLDPKVVDELIIDTLKHWEQPTKRFFEGLKTALTRTVDDIFRQHFGPWTGSAVYHKARDVVEQLLNSNFTEQEDVMASESLTDEREGPYVFNEQLFEREFTDTKEQYRRARYNARVKVYGQEMTQQTGKEWTPMDEDKLRKDEKKRGVLMAEPYGIEIDVIARVTSYYMIAARRFYESVCIRIESKFFKRLRASLRDDLETSLGIYEEKNGGFLSYNVVC